MIIDIGFNCRLFANNWRPAREDIAFAQCNGFSAIQFTGRFHDKAFLFDGQYFGEPSTVIAHQLRDANITPVFEMLIFINPQGKTALGLTPLDILEANLETIETLNAKCVHWHLGHIEPLKASTIERLEQELPQLFETAVSIAQRSDFQFGFEHNATQSPLFSTPAQCKALIEAVADLNFVWDLNHTKAEHFSAFQKLIPHMSMLHVSDTLLPKVNYHWPLGQGNIDLEAYFQTLSQKDFSGPAILEIGGQSFSGGLGQDTDEALINSKIHLEHILGKVG